MVIVGGLMVGVAMVTASLGTTIWHLYLCVGVIGGTYSKVYNIYINFPAGDIVLLLIKIMLDCDWSVQCTGVPPLHVCDQRLQPQGQICLFDLLTDLRPYRDFE